MKKAFNILLILIGLFALALSFTPLKVMALIPAGIALMGTLAIWYFSRNETSGKFLVKASFAVSILAIIISLASAAFTTDKVEEDVQDMENNLKIDSATENAESELDSALMEL